MSQQKRGHWNRPRRKGRSNVFNDHQDFGCSFPGGQFRSDVAGLAATVTDVPH